MRKTLPALLLMFAASPALGGPSPLVGKALPELNLSHAVQGPAWRQADLKGSVVVLDVFQLG